MGQLDGRGLCWWGYKKILRERALILPIPKGSRPWTSAEIDKHFAADREARRRVEERLGL